MEDNCPVEQTHQVLGWWFNKDENVYVLHSVIRQGDNMICVTPSPYDAENPFHFIPDEKIEMRKDDDEFIFSRNGQSIDAGVRKNSGTTLQEMTALRRDLESGCDPYDVLPE